MRAKVIKISCILWLWFLGCTFSWRFGKIRLVDGMGFKSVEFGFLLLYTGGIVAYLFWESVGTWFLLAELSLWLVVQFFSHEFYTIFGADPQKLKSYNKCFEGTVKMFPISETRLIPDLYHIVLHLLIAADLVLVIVAICLK